MTVWAGLTHHTVCPLDDPELRIPVCLPIAQGLLLGVGEFYSTRKHGAWMYLPVR